MKIKPKSAKIGRDLIVFPAEIIGCDRVDKWREKDSFAFLDVIDAEGDFAGLRIDAEGCRIATVEGIANG